VKLAPLALVFVACGLFGCKSKRDMHPDDPMPEPPHADDAGIAIDAAPVWPELEGYPRTTAERVISLPTRPDTPRFDVGGPVIHGDIAVVASSQVGFVAVDWRTGKLAWTKPTGTHVAPPVRTADGFVLIGDCLRPPDLPDGQRLLGCLRVVTTTGTDLAYLAIRAKPSKGIEAFVGERGDQAVWRDGDRFRWKRGAAAVSIDPVSGLARATDPTPPPLAIAYKDRKWDITQIDGRVVAYRGGTRRIAWRSDHRFTQLIGAVYLPEMSPMVRVVNAGSFRDMPEIDVLDYDATGSLHFQVLKPAPGIGLLAWATSSVGDTALVVRVDNSLRRDAVVAYAASAMLMWVYPLPEHARPDPVGVAISEDADAVVLFHDGDTITVLPDLSAPPTAPGAASASSKKPTP
jgi:hypothetical protein